MRNLSDLVCWIGVVVLAVFAVAWMLTRGLHAIVVLLLLFPILPCLCGFLCLRRLRSSRVLLICSSACSAGDPVSLEIRNSP